MVRGPMRHDIRLASLLLLATGLARAASGADAPGKVSPATLEIYKTRCQSCHMPDGNAPLEPMNLADNI